ncbi:MAG: DUF3656 domain-containing U32 family peptidase, partial [Prochlorothrix sp.]
MATPAVPRPALPTAHGPDSPTPQTRPELLAPAGNWECAKAAIENGADAIYFGLDLFNARMRAENFSQADLPDLMAWLHQRGVRGYVTLNTLIFTDELPQVEQYLKTLITAGVDAAIVQDVGLCRLIRHLSPDFPIHASTQMTITSAAGVAFAEELGCNLVVLARECSLGEIEKIQSQMQERLQDRAQSPQDDRQNPRSIAMPLEVFVHGALCVAYSGQCLTSESLGGRSANRGECAQACRMPYELVVEGEVKDLGDRRYLLSPQDLSGLEVLPQLLRSGVASLKIEGRLKAPEYVAAVTRVYRQAIDRLASPHPPAPSPSTGEGETHRPHPPTPSPSTGEGEKSQLGQKPLYPRERGWGEGQHNPESDRYDLEMAFSRGLSTGWFEGIDNQTLVHGQFGKKRGVYLGQVQSITRQGIVIRAEKPVKAGDGVVFDRGQPDRPEQGGRIYGVQDHPQGVLLTFGQGSLDLRQIRSGDKVWKTSDPDFDKRIHQTYRQETPQYQRPLHLHAQGHCGQPLVITATDDQGHCITVQSQQPLEAARNQPLDDDRLRQQLGRLGNTPFYLDSLTTDLDGLSLLPVKELNRLRREVVDRLEQQRRQPRAWTLNDRACWQDLTPKIGTAAPSSTGAFESQVAGFTGSQDASDRTSAVDHPPRFSQAPDHPPELRVLVRNLAQLEAALTLDISTLYCELEDPRQYPEVVARVRSASSAPHPIHIFVAPPRITKPKEVWILDQVRRCGADGYLVRNYDHLEYFRTQDGDRGADVGQTRCIGDFSLNIANPLTAAYFHDRFGLERLTASYDLNHHQLTDLLQHTPPQWLEVTIHQHMPMFHMEHCVFCAFLSEGKDFRDCGRPCEQYSVKLRDRTGREHPLQADAGCRNTVFNATAQTGAESVAELLDLGLRQFRLEFLQESPQTVIQTIRLYQQLLRGELSGTQLWRQLKAQSQVQNQLGVTRGTHAMP